MKLKSVRPKSLIVAASVSFVLGLVLSTQWDPTNLSRALESTATEPSALAAQAKPKSLPDFISLAKKLSPAVVNISTVQIRRSGPAQPNPFGESDPFGEFWRRFGEPAPQGPSREQSLGSGLIVSSDGYILTNYHVIENADEIKVKLSDERELEAEVVGKDSKTDIALLKIDAKGSLPTAPLGDSDRLEVGEWVLAVGNPFGLDHSVTSGIVSAKGRHIGAGPYDNFIQTDASINPGNSGGPLINTRGEVIGINTAIFSRNGGNIGIGFAIPINLVKDLLPQLKEHGKVTRGWLGVTIQKMTPELADSLGLAKPQGALVADVSTDGPAEQGGLQAGDVIVEFDGKEVKEPSELALMVAAEPVDKKVDLKALRQGEEVKLEVTIGQQPEERMASTSREKEGLGLAVQRVTPELARRLGLDRPEGVVVTGVEPGSIADDGGLRQGDVILEIDRKPIRSLEDFQRATARLPKGKSSLFLVQRDGTNLFFALKNYG